MEVGMKIRIDGGVVVAWSATGHERSARIDDGASRAWDNWASRDWAGRTVEQIIPPERFQLAKADFSDFLFSVFAILFFK